MGSSLFFNNYKTSAVQRVNNGILIDTILSALPFLQFMGFHIHLYLSTYVLCFSETGKILILCSKMPIYRRSGSQKDRDQVHIG